MYLIVFNWKLYIFYKNKLKIVLKKEILKYSYLFFYQQQIPYLVLFLYHLYREVYQIYYTTKLKQMLPNAKIRNITFELAERLGKER